MNLTKITINLFCFIIAVFFTEAANLENLKIRDPMPVIRDEAAYESLIAAVNDHYKPLSENATRFYFIRHGESEGNKEGIYAGQTLNVDLTEKGEQDAVKAGERIKIIQEKEGWFFDDVFSSPSLRATRTTEITLSQVASMVKGYQSDERLMERHIGRFDGRPMEGEYRKRTLAWEAGIEKLDSFWEKITFKHDPSDLQEESLQQVLQRVQEFLLEKNGGECKGKNVLVGSHGGVLKTLLMAAAALNYSVILEYHRFEAPNGSILVLEVQDSNFKIIYTDGFKFRQQSKHL